MKLEKKKLLLVSFMLFSMFFGAGNLIFPPFLGQCAGRSTPIAIIGFLITAVVLPVLGVVVVAKFGGLQKLANKVNPIFAVVFTILIYLSIGPGLGIPRAASVPFEMAIAPYLPESVPLALSMLGYSLVFFLIALWLSLTPKKLVGRIGKFLTPLLLILICVLFGTFLFKGVTNVAEPQVAYEKPFVQGFLDGYQTMDAIAALNFGLVISLTITEFNVKEKKDLLHNTMIAGIIAGSILAIIYLMLSFMGMQTSAVYPLQDNGAWTLRCIVKQLFGTPGAILLATIFTLACLTTCVGLITSISQYFSTLTKKISYKAWVIIITLFSFIICNQGLNTILSISVPILNTIYPVSILLIVLGLLSKFFEKNKYIFPWTIGTVSVISILYSLENMNVPLGFITNILNHLPFYSVGMGWVTIAIFVIVLSILVNFILNKINNKKCNS